jgi:hypothetical protein
MRNTDRWTTGMPSSRHKPAFDGLPAGACLSCWQISRPILSRRATAKRTAGEFARGAMAGLSRQRYLLPLFAGVQNCTLDASFAPPRRMPRGTYARGRVSKGSFFLA